MADQLIIECYENYATNSQDPCERHIINEAIEVMKTTDTPEGLMNKIFARLPEYDRKLITKTIRQAAKHKNEAMKIQYIAESI